MILGRTLQAGLVLSGVLLAGAAAAAPKSASHVKEQDVTLDDDTDDDAPPKKHAAEAPDDSDTDDAETPPPVKRTPRTDDEPTPPRHEEPANDATADPAVWFALGLMQDVTLVSGSEVCTEKNQVSGGYTCIRSSGSQYHGTPVAGSGGKLGGISLAATRVTLASYFRLADKLSAGVRLGYAVLGRGPKPDGGSSFLSFSAEAEGAYWLSSHAYSTKVVGTFLELSAGLAEVDGKSKVTVQENTMVPPPVNQLDNPASQTLTAYQKAGAGFAGVGAGMFIPVGAHGGLIGDLRVIQLFPTSGTALSLDVSGAFGL
ncbi:MAG TPA: hypothetical protein VHU80_04525 [Polyangiaceae bacterium]|jgi:hypothetical protein|nr:hypothetical protein [Polyangiaceae bacterium]